MVKVWNDERGPTYDFIKKGGKAGETVSIGPGEAADIDVDPKDSQFIAATTFGTLVLGAKPKPTAASNVVPSAGAAPAGANVVPSAEKPKK